jgi:hypothetical protein
MKSKFKKGQFLICTHYHDLPPVIVNSIHGKEVWVIDGDTGKLWWGPASWFQVPAKPKKKAAKPIRKPKTPKGLMFEGSLCDNGIPGCSCNQSASVGQ